MVGPEGIELLLHPLDRLRGRVFPEKFIVQRPSGFGFVDASHEGGFRSVGERDDAGLAVNKSEVLVGQDFDLKFAGGEETVKAGKAGLRDLPTGVHEAFGFRGAPLLPQRGGCGAGSVHVLRTQAGIADYTDRAGDGVNGFAGGLEDGATKVACDAVVGFRVPKPLGEEGLGQFLATR